MPLRVGNKEVILRRGNLEVPALYRANFRAFRSSFPPVITQNPTGLTVTAGNTATFTSSATGKPDPTVQWQISTNNGSSWSDISGATSSTYTTSNLIASDNDNEYRAVWTNEVGSATSTAASVNVQTPPSITLQPLNLTSTAGNTATFSSTASGNPSPTAQWQISTDNGSTWNNIGGATNSSYTTASLASSNDGYRYRCIWTNSIGSNTSTAVILTVQYAPIVSDHPDNINISVDNIAYFSASATANPSVSSIVWQTSSNNVNWVNLADSNSTQHNYLATSIGNIYYRAVFTNTIGSTATNSAIVSVINNPVVLNQASGGTETLMSNGGRTYKIHQFTDTGTSSITFNQDSYVDYLIVGGGGGTGYGTEFTAGDGGGGAGGFRYGFNQLIAANTYDVQVGAGGHVSVQTRPSGSASSFNNISSAGGGGGGNWRYTAASGGSGGGGRRDYSQGGPWGAAGNIPTTDPPQGNNGGNGRPEMRAGGGGGGGGAGTAGSSAISTTGGNGGAGKYSFITGVNEAYAGGGGGGRENGPGGAGGVGGGGAGSRYDGQDGGTNTGGGGGGSGYNRAVRSKGGSGVVIIRYRIS